MTRWNDTDLAKVGAAEGLDLRSERTDGTLRTPVTMWVVRVDRGTQARHQGRIDAGGVQRDVTFRPADPAEYADVDAAYRNKYGRYTTIVEHVLTDRARESTLRLEPR